MNRTIGVYVDQSSWPAPPALPQFPPTFPVGHSTSDVHIPSLLLLIGAATTPVQAVGVSLSEYWAWVRYLHAISPDPDLRLTPAFASLDAHQKTILSDDFGMGASLYWLTHKLNLGPFCDGRYFIERVAATIGASTKKTAKRGPNKSPDFVAQGSGNIWHVVECKGTQSGSLYRLRQLGDSGPPPTGGIAQKQTIDFPAGHTGQRLACGLAIGVEGGLESTNLHVVDPEYEEKFAITENNLYAGTDALVRANAARGLRLAGYFDAASAVAAPSGTKASARSTRGPAELRRRETVERKRTRATAELSRRDLASTFEFDGEKFQGRRVKLDLPRPVAVDGREIRSVDIIQGVNAEVLNEMAAEPLTEEPILDIGWRTKIAETKVAGADFEAELQIGEFFHSRIELREQAATQA
ncbi:MAG: hypothetical protein GC204_03645 [Chloroflexi bacterium]|nr:hypothetical protein [Chloroflexota bacterium]